MKTTVEDISTTMKKVVVEIDEGRVAEKLDEAFALLSREVKIPGFRPGKAPRNLLETRYGPQVREDVSRNLVGETLPAAVEEAGFKPLGYPEIEKDTPAKGKPFKYTASIEVRPSFEVPDFKDVEVEKEKVEVTEQQVRERLEGIHKSQGKLNAAADDKKVETGDYVTFAYRTFEGDEPIEDISSDNFMVEVGSGDFHPRFEESLLGMEKGSEKDIEIHFEEDYHHSRLAGKHVRFHVTVQGISTMELPALDDEFAKGLGGNFEDLEGLKNKIRESMLEDAEKRADRMLKQKLLEKVASTVEVEVPWVLVEAELGYAVNSIKMNLSRSGSSLEKAGLTEEKLREDFLPPSEKRARELLVLGQIAAQEGINVGESDLEEAFEGMAVSTPHSADEVKRYYESQGLVDGLREKLLEEKTLKYMVENANLKTAGEVAA